MPLESNLAMNDYLNIFFVRLMDDVYDGDAAIACCSTSTAIHPSHKSPNISNRRHPAQDSILTPSPIRSSSDSDLLSDLMGSVFATPEKSCNNIFAPYMCGGGDERKKSSEAVKETNGHLPPFKEESLDTSFSKLLDLSGSSSSFGRLNNAHFTDMADLNLSFNMSANGAAF